MSDAPDIVGPKGARLVAAEPDPFKGGDVYRWAMDQTALIRAGRYDEVDWINVADEIESVGKSEFRSLSSHLEIVLVHILKWDYQPERQSRSWIGSISEHRRRVERDLAESPSLKPRLDEAIEGAYELARFVAARETGSVPEAFPAVCPYDWEAIMMRPFVLEQTSGSTP